MTNSECEREFITYWVARVEGYDKEVPLQFYVTKDLSRDTCQEFALRFSLPKGKYGENFYCEFRHPNGEPIEYDSVTGHFSWDPTASSADRPYLIFVKKKPSILQTLWQNTKQQVAREKID